jgi:hypothetical protein
MTFKHSVLERKKGKKNGRREMRERERELK